MKTTKKGFTLIELIVVIAIIGVLAAILVPTMLGYVRKSKLSSANSTASSIYKAINSALTELDEEGCDIGGDYLLTWDGSDWAESDSPEDIDGALEGDQFDSKVSNFFADISKVKSVSAAVHSGNCIAVACCSDKTYTGTYPSGVITNDNYDSEDYKPSDDTPPVVNENALTAAVDKAGYEGDADDGYTKKTGSSTT